MMPSVALRPRLQESAFPVFDTNSVHARKAVEWALSITTPNPALHTDVPLAARR
ncbi:hypothetical protein [Thermithiobacillus plumbiphilus]|uniref:Uncharacterized protein n=1 Tax=Thermithiobacillus plumbiphilus TaxID=1729899 RepID=A0ABU9D5F4_9PROT